MCKIIAVKGATQKLYSTASLREVRAALKFGVLDKIILKKIFSETTNNNDK